MNHLACFLQNVGSFRRGVVDTARRWRIETIACLHLLWCGDCLWSDLSGPIRLLFDLTGTCWGHYLHQVIASLDILNCLNSLKQLRRHTEHLNRLLYLK